MADPKCPECSVAGLKHIVTEPSEQESNGGDAWFDVVFCSECGHVYGVFAKVVYTPTPTSMPPMAGLS